MKKLLTITVLGLSLALGACSSHEEPIVDPVEQEQTQEDDFVQVESLRLSARQKQVATIANEPALAMLIEAEKLQLWNDGITDPTELKDDGNILFSPMSVSAAMAMATNGARGETQQQMLATLWNGATIDEVNALYAKLLDDGTRLDKDVELKLANSVWVNIGFNIVPSFTQVVSNNYKAPINQLDLSSSQARDAVAKWCSDATNGKIKMDNFTDGPLKLIVLINALYFNGKWSTPFDAEATFDGTFNNTLGETEAVKMMSKEMYVKGYEDAQTSMVQLNYGNGKYYIDLIKPVGGVSLHDYILGLDMTTLDRMESEMEANCHYILQLPRFSMGKQLSMKEVLISMGIHNAFDNPTADFSGLFSNNIEDKAISSVTNNTSITFSEAGTEATSTTTVSWIDTADGRPPVYAFDHPFLFLLRERESGAIILAGKVATINGF